jgi:hypothetical protein
MKHARTQQIIITDNDFGFVGPEKEDQDHKQEQDQDEVEDQEKKSSPAKRKVPSAPDAAARARDPDESGDDEVDDLKPEKEKKQRVEKDDVPNVPKKRDRQTGNQILTEFQDFLAIKTNDKSAEEKYEYKQQPSFTKNYHLLVAFFSQLSVKEVFGEGMTKQKVKEALLQRLRSLCRRLNKTEDEVEKEREHSILVDRRRRHRSRRLGPSDAKKFRLPGAMNARR